MEVRQCRRCSKLFQYRGKSECPDCIQKSDEAYNRVRHYLFEHPNANIIDICENCEVDDADVMAWTREGRLMLGAAAGLSCEKCGKSISAGRFCKDCGQQLADTLGVAKKSMEKSAFDTANRQRDGMRMNREKG